MTKKYQHTEEITPKVSESVGTYNAHGPHCSAVKQAFGHERIIATTMSVDEYFDKLISLVREDYASSLRYC